MSTAADPAAVRDLVRESRAAQGLPATIEDPTALAAIARLLGGPKP